jgi:DNA-binding NarL/FixJ family response regulator
MNAVELMEAKLAGLSRRVDQLETLARSATDAGAADVAREAGLPVEILLLPERQAERRALAGKLRERGWSVARIARALRCCERTVERWVAAVEKA